jgi:hypothetical protein
MLDGEPFAAFGSPGFQYQLATARLHPFSKTVRLRAPAIVRLERPLRHLFSSFENFECSTEAS